MEQYFSSDPSSESHQLEVKFSFGERDYTLRSDRGVFAKRRLDKGSELLLQTIIATWSADRTALRGVWAAQRRHRFVIDLGCGYGPLGIVLADHFDKLRVLMCDINSRAVDLADGNMRRVGLRYCSVVQSDGIPPETTAPAAVVTNPPIRAGKETVHRLLYEAAWALQPGGELWLVVRRKQGADSLKKWLTELFTRGELPEQTLRENELSPLLVPARVDTVARSGGFHVIRAVRGHNL